SRVGSAAQTKAMKKVAGKLRLELAQYRELAAFAQFGSDLDEATQKQINRGARLTEILKQGQYEPFPFEYQVAALYAGVNELFDDIPLEKIKKAERGLHEYLHTSKRELMETIAKERALSEESEQRLKMAIEEYKKTIPV
ncbi:MAG: F0F1 ATP synthase subunit alpha, partial [Patescibacteria group bacterium]